MLPCATSLSKILLLAEVSSPVVERKKAMTIPPMSMVLIRSTALVEILTKSAKAKQKSKAAEVWLIGISGANRWNRLSVILPPEVI